MNYNEVTYQCTLLQSNDQAAKVLSLPSDHRPERIGQINKHYAPGWRQSGS